MPPCCPLQPVLNTDAERILFHPKTVDVFHSKAPSSSHLADTGSWVLTRAPLLLFHPGLSTPGPAGPAPAPRPSYPLPGTLLPQLSILGLTSSPSTDLLGGTVPGHPSSWGNSLQHSCGSAHQCRCQVCCWCVSWLLPPLHAPQEHRLCLLHSLLHRHYHRASVNRAGSR